MPDSPLRGRRILIAEDEFFLADALKGELRHVGAEMLGPVACVESGFRLLDTGPAPDAASLDVNLGGAQVFPLADVLIARAVPFVFTTGYGRGMIPEAYARIRYIEKPIAPEALLKELESLLRT